MKNKSINWLEQICEAISALAGSVSGANQSDWNENDSSSASYIKNKPTIKQADWNEATATDPGYIKNKPTIPEGALIVEGDWGEYFYVESADVITAIKSAIAAGRVVYLKDTNTEDALGYSVAQINAAGNIYFVYDYESSLALGYVEVAQE